MTHVIVLQLFGVAGTSLGLMISTDSVEVGSNMWLHGALDVTLDIVVYIPVGSQTYHVARTQLGCH